ncbi:MULTISPECIES: 3-hydroxylacyl-ACP dehydratase [unclassified Acinetobacter]|uniref:ApeP family dehydratase n=1 Tax=unclassified Acinetobacter TaxID=196816 RepID=UPI000DCFF64C|nr:MULTISPECIES: 3-hydroxylacyl-ACP dehydratase [unclassified Acinetobacter]
MMDAVQFIPHEQPMVFVDHLIEANDSYAIAELQIRPELMFCEAEGLPTWSSIELMAQTISAYAGHKGQTKGLPPKVGFLLGTRKMQLPCPYFAVGNTVRIRVEQSYLHEGLGQFNCEIEYQEHRFSAMLSVFEPENMNDAIGK